MIGAVDFIVYIGFSNVMHTLVCYEKIINTPADVSIACSSLLVPIGISAGRMGMEVAE